MWVWGKIRIELKYLVSIFLFSFFFFGGEGGWNILKLNAGILFQNSRGDMLSRGLLGGVEGVFCSHPPILKKPARFTGADTVAVIIEKSETTPLLLW